jgi:hypothetical protein
MKSDELREPIRKIDRDHGDQPSPCDSSRHPCEQTRRCAQINPQASRANRNASAKQDERPLRLPMTHQRKATLQGEAKL